MFDIPIGARHIVIEENETSPHIIGKCVSDSFPPVKHMILLVLSSRIGQNKDNFTKCYKS